MQWDGDVPHPMQRHGGTASHRRSTCPEATLKSSLPEALQPPEEEWRGAKLISQCC